MEDLYERLHRRPARPTIQSPHPPLPPSEFSSPPSLHNGQPGTTQRRGSVASTATTNIDTYGEGGGLVPRVRIVTGAPHRDHWKKDEDAPECILCGRVFNLVTRRHHCRKCGDIFCLNCCSQYVRLDQNVQFNPAGVRSRVCNTCYEDFQSRIIPLKPAPDDDDDDQEVPLDDAGNVLTFNADEDPNAKMPTDWNWSTF
ncbi:hypothetical protein BJ742DRAFT_789261 [Cladochytrium replicatum]|nr:hypothetical protein BJ742DRAFT_789261 [Cladochytrium replicatum]